MDATAPTAAPLDAAASSSRARRGWLVLIALLVLLGLVAAARLAIGSSVLGYPTGPAADAIWWARCYRLAIAGAVGVALAISGVALQALLRNPLAEPYILGLSTGAAAGVMAQALVFHYLHLTMGFNQIGALVGAGMSMLIVFAASRWGGFIGPLCLLLTGVVLSTINGALLMLLNYLVGPGGVRDEIGHWMVGSLDESVSRATLYVVAGSTLAGLGVLLAAARPMDLATLSDTEAHSLGVHLGRLRTLLFFVASVLAAGAVVLAGPIAFVGLICPHVARLLLGPRHGPLLVGAALLGAALIILADVISAGLHLATGFGLLPIGIFTAMVGGPVFLWMLHPRLGRGGF